MDKISLIDLEVFAHHGVFDFEKANGQTFLLSCECSLNTQPAATNDDLSLALDYGALAKRLCELFQSKTFDLIESAAAYCAHSLLREFPLIQELTLIVKKPSAPLQLSLAYPAVSLKRAWHSCILALGSNIEPRQAHLDSALAALECHPDIQVINVSPWLETEPVGGPANQGNFINGAVEIKTLLTPYALLESINAIEAAEGRERLVHWGPRTLDIDIIYYDDLLLFDAPKLIIPHPLALERSFVMEPLCTIAPYWIDPRYGQAVSVLWQNMRKL